MFRQLATDLGGGVVGANLALTNHRPSVLSNHLEAMWRDPNRNVALSLGRPNPANQQMAVPAPPDAQPAWQPMAGGTAWHHIVYAYLLENTRIIEIFRRVIDEWVHGERLPAPTVATQRWIHATEELFLGGSRQFSVRSLTSQVRPDSAAIRRNAYFRLLGMDLNHGGDRGGTYPYVKPDAANREFAPLFEALLREVWLGYTNRRNYLNQNTTDEGAMNALIVRLNEMLNARRIQGNLSREEFDAVATLSWFHLTVEHNNVVVQNLNAQTAGVADRLRRIGERVGVPSHARTDAYFQLAEPMSGLLRLIENHDNVALQPNLLYGGGIVTNLMITIVTQWSIATGRNIKDPTTRLPLGSVLAGAPPSGLALVGSPR